MPTRVVKVNPTKQVTIKLTPSKSCGAMRVDLSGSGVKPTPQKGVLDEASRRNPARTVEAAITTTKPTTDQHLEAISQAIPALVPIFRGVLMRSEAAATRFARPCAFVVNLAHSPGTHWCAIYAHLAEPRGG